VIRGNKVTFEGTLELSATCLCSHVQQAARSIGRRFDEAFRPLDLTNWQFTLIAALNRPEPPTINVIAHDLAIDRTTITANLKPLERRGLVTIATDEHDKRVRRIALTKAGDQLLQDAFLIWRKTQTSVERELIPADIDEFRTALRAVTAL
jgi:DNA-binding MarR family transcriptional regulator